MEHIRTATPEDLDAIAAIEEECFPKEEAATREQLKERIKGFGKHFFVIEIDGQIIGFINGMVTDQKTISDDLYEKTELHREDGKWQSVFGLDVRKEYRRNGYAGKLINHLIQSAKDENRQGVILTCKEKLIPFYEKFGFENQGVSKSVHGGAVWYDMVLEWN